MIECYLCRTKKNKSQAPAVTKPSVDNAASSSKPKKTTSSTKSSSAGATNPSVDDDATDKTFVPPKHPTRRSVEPEIEEIPLDQYGNEIVEDLPEVSRTLLDTMYLAQRTLF